MRDLENETPLHLRKNAPSMSQYLVLFDIDGTLVWPDGLGKASMLAALERVYGTQGGLAAIDFHGQTDRQLVADALRSEGISQETIGTRFDEFLSALTEEMAARLPDHDLRACDGGLRLVEQLRARDDVPEDALPRVVGRGVFVGQLDIAQV